MPATAIATRESEDAYMAAYARSSVAFGGGARLRQLRQAAIERFGLLGFPTTHNEEWKYTNLAPFLKTP